jgi:hypothetical protein
MQTITDEALADRIATKAPAWAQDVIYALDRQLAEARAHIAALKGEAPADSNVAVQDYVTGNRPLGKDTAIAFALPEGTIVIKHAEGIALEVYCTGPRRNCYPHILPSSANTFLIQLGER